MSLHINLRGYLFLKEKEKIILFTRRLRLIYNRGEKRKKKSMIHAGSN